MSEFALDDVEEAVRSKPDGLVVAGGDGSLACVAAPAARAGIRLAVIPTGTANDFARELEIPLELGRGVPASRPKAAAVRRLDVGRMGDRPFLNVASTGLPPAAAEHADGLKEKLGPLAYAVGAARAGVEEDPVHLHRPLRRERDPLRRGVAGHGRLLRRLRRRLVDRDRAVGLEARRRRDRGRLAVEAGAARLRACAGAASASRRA